MVRTFDGAGHINEVVESLHGEVLLTQDRVLEFVGPAECPESHDLTLPITDTLAITSNEHWLMEVDLAIGRLLLAVSIVLPPSWRHLTLFIM